MKTTLSAFGIHRSSLLCDLPPQAGGIPKSDLCCNYHDMAISGAHKPVATL